MYETLKNKQILALLVSSFAVLFVGMGLLPILPLFAASFDASNTTTGLYFAGMYLANSLGPIVTAWLINRLPKRTVFIGGGLVGLPALAGLAAAQNFVQVVFFTMLLWFSGGMLLSLVSILTGLHTDEKNRGKAFSLMAMVGPLGSLFGGAAVGPLIAWQGYRVMFTVLAVEWIIIPLIGWLFLKEGPQKDGEPTGLKTRLQGKAPAGLGASFTRLMMIAFLGSMAVNVSRFGSSLSMKTQHFSPEAVSSVAMVSGLIAIPATLAIGAISDRLGRKQFLFASYLFAMSSSLVLTGAAQLWQFWLASILNLLAISTSGAMTQALTAEVVPVPSVSKGLSYLNTINAVASILCFAVGGALYDLLGLPVVFLGAAILALIAGMGIQILIQPKISALTGVQIPRKLKAGKLR
jgi:MFS transporter, DHA1 family, multidrug resistance protein